MVVEGQHIVSDIDFDIKGLTLAMLNYLHKCWNVCVRMCVCIFALVHMCSQVCVCVTAIATCRQGLALQACTSPTVTAPALSRKRPGFSGLELEERHGRASRP